MEYKFSPSWKDFKKQLRTRNGLMFFMIEVMSILTLFVMGFLLLLFFWGLGVM